MCHNTEQPNPSQFAGCNVRSTQRLLLRLTEGLITRLTQQPLGTQCAACVFDKSSERPGSTDFCLG